MKIKNRPLMNPTPRDIERINALDGEHEEEIVNELKVSKDQLRMEMDPPSKRAKQFYSGIKQKIREKNQMIEVMQVWRTPAIPFSIISSVLTIGIILIGSVIKFNDIPPSVPLFYNSIDRQWELVDKSSLFIVGIVISVLEMILINFISRIFTNDRRLSLVLSWILVYLNVMLIIVIGHIYSLG